MLIKRWLGQTLAGLGRSWTRYTAALTLCVLAAVLSIIQIHAPGTWDHAVSEWITRILATLMLGVPLMLALRQFHETLRNEASWIRWVSYALGIAALALYLFFLLPIMDAAVPAMRYAALTAALWIAFICIPFLPDEGQPETYLLGLGFRLLVTGAYSGIIIGGCSAILFTLDRLLNVPVIPENYADVSVLTALLFAPAYFLAAVPEKGDAPAPYPRLFRALLLYVVLPLLSVYTVILYVYFGKLLVTMDWPQGLVANLVLWYALIGIVVLFLLKPLTEENQWGRFFYTWFPRLLPPSLAMLFAAIWIRIAQYGLTENRYFVIAGALWALGIAVYLIIRRRSRGIVIPVSAVLVLVLTVSGPWSAFSVSMASQNHRLHKMLTQYGMIQNGVIAATTAEVPAEDRREMYAILEYFDSSHSLADVAVLPAGTTLPMMAELINIPESPYYRQLRAILSPYGKGLPIDIRGYDLLIDIDRMEDETTFDLNGRALRAAYDSDTKEFTLYEGDHAVYRYDINTLAARLPVSEQPLSPEDVTFDDNTGDMAVRYIIRRAYVYADHDQAVAFDYVYFYVLLKMK
jgi:hypothetical protein